MGKNKKGSYADQLIAKKAMERRHFNNIMAICALYVLHAEFGFGHDRLMRFNDKFKEITTEAVDKYDDLCVEKMQRELKERCGIVFREADGREMRF